MNLDQSKSLSFNKGLMYGEMAESVKNTVRKGEISCYEQFLLFPQRFQNICTANVF